jgi:hypothetical protein
VHNEGRARNRKKIILLVIKGVNGEKCKQC